MHDASVTDQLAGLTPKGDRRAASILQAATTVLARDGFGGATLGRIATEAGADKRSVIYYFGTREKLLVRVVHDLGGRIAESVRGATPAHAGPNQTLDEIVAATWKGVTSDSQLVRAYFALVAGDVEAGDVDDALGVIKDTYRSLLRDQLLTLQSAGWALRGDLDDSASALFALLRGYLLQWLEEGPSAFEHGGLVQFKSFIALQFHPSADGRQPL
ncbi:TetR/AcrR family transcriptional regulator [Patulibacter medicamentivorans]|uniref:TetR/AcrR family transcriptional regulator n=1 Tax=Patulibacter medicamentivorans TaxID=1097667 RepID=UPI00030AB633|nr:TetR/AcrR family transcriptional regulator [Patulibacter medicamentivorans]